MRHLRILCILTWFLIGLGKWGMGEDASPIFSFAHISDAHVHDESFIEKQKKQGIENGYRNYHLTPAKLTQACLWIDAQEEIPFMVFTGDMVEKATPARYEALLSCLEGVTTPWVNTPGNHDYRLEKLMPADKSHGGVDFAFAWKGLHFVGFSTFNPPGMSHLVAKESLEKLASYLEAHRKDPVILLCHSPFMNHQGETGTWESPSNVEQVMEVIDRVGNVIAVLCGHDHTFWWREEDGILHACAQGFCEGLGVPAFSFLVWRVYPNRLAGEVFYVKEDGSIALDPSHRIDFSLPDVFRLTKTKMTPSFVPVDLPLPKTSVLETWFGVDWVYAKGFALPPSWREDAVLLPADKAKKAWIYEAIPPKASPLEALSDAPWYAPQTMPEEGWREASVPARYWNGKEPQPARAVYLRIPIEIPETVHRRAVRYALKALYYKDPRLYLNGVPLRRGGGGAAMKWNMLLDVDSDRFKAGTNLLAVRLQSSGWGGYAFDFELSVQTQKPNPDQNPPHDR